MKRADRSLLTNWWFQIDWKILGLIVAFGFVGILAGIHSVHLLDKIFLFYIAAGIILFAVPMMTRTRIIAMSWAILAACLALFAITYAYPHAMHGSIRWARIFGWSLMPADLLKPAFVVLTAWFLVQIKRRAPDDWIADAALWRGGWWPAYLAVFAAILVAMFEHPDVGNVFIYLLLLAAMMFWADIKKKYVLGMVALGAAAVGLAMIQPHFRARILGGVDDYQIRRSLDAIKNGGLWGRGEESFLFGKIPMENTDFVFASIAEMWGAVAGAALLAAMFALFCITFRRAAENRDEFSSLVIFGAAFLFAIHVSLNVFSATVMFLKGTTLPFISYGGSSLIGFSILFGIVLAVIRQDKWGWAK